MGTTPPDDLLDLIHDELKHVISENPAATSSEAFLQNPPAATSTSSTRGQVEVLRVM